MMGSAPSDDVLPQTPSFEEAGQAISQGKRHLLVCEYGLAVATLGKGVGMLASQHGELADKLAEPYLLYGKALLFLAREEAGVLGSAVPAAEKVDDKEDGAKIEAIEIDKEEAKEETKPAADNEKEKPVEDEKKPAEEAQEEPAAGGSGSAGAGPSGSSNEKASTSGLQQNGEAHENSNNDSVDEEGDDANSHLRIAWEVLQRAKIIFTKRGPPGWKFLTDAHRLLGEVSMERGNQPSAVVDFNTCLDLLQKIEPANPRSLAEIHYQLGLAHSLSNEFDASIEQFLKATSLLEARIKDLESSKEEIEAKEIQEINDLLPQISNRIKCMHERSDRVIQLKVESLVKDDDSKHKHISLLIKTKAGEFLKIPVDPSIIIKNLRKFGIKNYEDLKKNPGQKEPELIKLDIHFKHKYITVSAHGSPLLHSLEEAMLSQTRLRRISNVSNTQSTPVNESAGGDLNENSRSYHIVLDDHLLKQQRDLQTKRIEYNKEETLFRIFKQFSGGSNEISIEKVDDVLMTMTELRRKRSEGFKDLLARAGDKISFNDFRKAYFIFKASTLSEEEKMLIDSFCIPSKNVNV